jgi:hypothetical protein
MRCRQSRCMPMITLCADDHLIPTYNTDVRNFSAIIDVDSPSMSKEMYGFLSPPNWNFNRSSSGLSVDEAGTASFALFFLVGGPNMTRVDEAILYCLIEFVEPDCGISAQWLPSTIVTVTLVVKGIVTIMFIRRSKYFQVRVYNNLGDVVDLSVCSLWYAEFGLLPATSNERNNVTVSEVKAVRKRLPFKICGPPCAPIASGVSPQIWKCEVDHLRKTGRRSTLDIEVQMTLSCHCTNS